MKWITPVASFVLALSLAGCADKEEVKNPPEKAPAEGKEANGGYTFTSFDLDVDLEGTNDAIDVSYEKDKNGTEASYMNKDQNKRLNGDDAMKELDEIFASFVFNESTPDDEVLKTVEEAFDVPADAKSVEVEIDYAGGAEKEYRR
ncbi:hypothetical protein F9802_03315 [Bacillus aerolatus]|uniref:YusW-like protein n=1 Tax=Bacillus aerolatus TaxID=2653354 RepID=A0A6I1FKK4_9BACI|nr:YusW family protein [Bacillus aerolatus]KAB7709150.1 hypothetical protein F9802_03315 [Bacillus aerolatus]